MIDDGELMPDLHPPPFGTRELLAAVAGAATVLDAGCGSGRLTVALAQAGAEATGFDTNPSQLEQARGRAADAGVAVRLLEADSNVPLPFADASFAAVVSRLSLMIAADPVATLREYRRVVEPGGLIATALWAPAVENVWFDAPRQAIGGVLGADHARFARAFGKLGGDGELAGVHRNAGLIDVEAVVVRDTVDVSSAGEHWRRMALENGHFTRVDATLDDEGRDAVIAELEKLIGTYLRGDALALPRALVLVTGRAPA